MKKSAIKKKPVKTAPAKKVKVKKKAEEEKAGAKKMTRKQVINSTDASEVVSGDSVIMLGESVTIKDVRRFYSQLAGYIDCQTSLCIDASAVKKIDTAGLQMLLGFVKKKLDQNVVIKWLGPTEEVLNKARTLGVVVEMGLVEGT